jgi:Ribonuclease R winged-helix domain
VLVPAPPHKPGARAAAGGTFGEMVLMVLREADRPLSTAEVREAINASGQQMNREQARSALHYLVRKERISRVGPGLWELPERRSTTSFGPAGGAAGPNGTGENAIPYTLGFSPERA